MSKKTQIQRVKEILETTKGIKGGITSLGAFGEFGITRLSAIIHTLRHREGMNIVSVSEKITNRYGEKVIFKRYLLLENLSVEDLENNVIYDAEGNKYKRLK